MDRKSDDRDVQYGSVKLTHHALTAERAASLRGRKARSVEVECIAIGHAWSDDPAREGGTICMVCQVVRWP